MRNGFWRALGMALGILAVTALANPSPAPAAEKKQDNRLFELRTYHTHPGKLEALLARFRNHTVKLFEKHGATNVGYWIPVDPQDQRLIYVLAFPDRAARDLTFKNFGADPEWQAARKASEANGPLVSKIEVQFLKTTDYSPAPKGAAGERVFELRHYTTPEGRLEALHSRFRDHTVKLFEQHGMTNVIYWSPAAGEPAATTTLVYLLAHQSVDSARQSFDTFRKDPKWVAAREESEKRAGGSLTVPNGVKSTFLRAVDFSPLK